ncbi:hypothetical protein SLS62_000690 [Diatrype stigma]|uniref:Uncharacterized protein n=1 Tax=Diatrype stigma TaxID=117547 RepID=A0AAN9YWF9_9PEZI
MDLQQEAESASQGSTTPTHTSSSPGLSAQQTDDPIPTAVQPTILSPEEKQDLIDRILQAAANIIVSSNGVAYEKIHSPEFDSLIAHITLYVTARAFSGLLFRKLDDLLEAMRSLVRHYVAIADDLTKRGRELAEAASGQGPFRIVGKGKAGQRDWDGDAAVAEADLLAENAAKEKGRADSLRRKVKELLDSVRGNISWYGASGSVIHVGIVDKALHQYEDILKELGIEDGEREPTTTTMPTTTTTMTTIMTLPQSGGEPSGLSAEEGDKTSESGSSRQSSSGSDTVRG